MIGIYFSGTGNTKHCVEKLVESLDKNSRVIPLESNGVIDEINNSKQIVFGYPIQYSNMPYFVREFIKKNSLLWKDKEIFIVVTMGAFSGDGSGCSARLFKKYGAKILGGLHLKMPDSVSDSKLLKKGLEGNRKIVKEADWKIENAVAMIRKGKYPSQGLSFFFFSHLLGLFGQRLWFYNKTAGYSSKLKISNECIGCGKCSKICPINNLIVKDGKAFSLNKCTMCYRCISSCPKKAITLLGDKIVEQSRYDKYC